MVGINKSPVLMDLETVFTRVRAAISPKAIGRGEMIALIVQNPLTNSDGTTNTNEIFVGSASNMIYFMIPGQESPIIYAEDEKDIYIKLNFPEDTPNGGVLTANVLTVGEGYTVGDVLTITPLVGDSATVTVATLDGHISAAAINNAGAGYIAGATLVVVGGNGLGRIVIDTVDGGGAILTSHVTVAGSGYTNGATVAVTGGGGVGATFDLTASRGVATITVTTPGTGFSAGENAAAAGGTGIGAVIHVITVETVLPETADITLLIYRQRKGGRQ